MLAGDQKACVRRWAAHALERPRDVLIQRVVLEGRGQAKKEVCMYVSVFKTHDKGEVRRRGKKEQDSVGLNR